MTDPKKITEADCAYLAALIDLRGSVKIHREQRRGTTYRTLLLQFHEVPMAVAAWFLEKFGPARCVSRPEGAEITLVTTNAAEICVHAYPYLVSMKHVARLVTRFAQSISTKRRPQTPEAEAIREEVDRELQAIERRGGRR